MEKRKLIFIIAVLSPILLIFMMDLIIIAHSSTRYLVSGNLIENSGFLTSPPYFIGAGGGLILFCISLVFCYFYYKDLKNEEPTWRITFINLILSVLLLIFVLVFLNTNTAIKCNLLVPSYSAECENSIGMLYKLQAESGELGINDCTSILLSSNSHYRCILSLAIAEKDVSICENVREGGLLTSVDCISVFNQRVAICDNPLPKIITAVGVGYQHTTMTDSEICKERSTTPGVDKEKIFSCKVLNKRVEVAGVADKTAFFDCECLFCP